MKRKLTIELPTGADGTTLLFLYAFHNGDSHRVEIIDNEPAESVEASDGYRILQKGETIQEGDEYCKVKHPNEWMKTQAAGSAVGDFGSTDTYRRKLPAPLKLEYGKRYVRRDGQITGPLVMSSTFARPFKDPVSCVVYREQQPEGSLDSDLVSRFPYRDLQSDDVLQEGDEWLDGDEWKPITEPFVGCGVGTNWKHFRRHDNG